MKDGWLEIVNLEKLVNFSRRVVFHNFDERNNDLDDQSFIEKINKIEQIDDPEMDTVLPFEESKNIFQELIKKKIGKKTKKIKYFIKESDYDEALSQLNQRMVSNIVKGLVAKGLLESAYDSEKNDFVFWMKTANDDNKEKPETD